MSRDASIDPVVSILVPIYNAEKYLAQCLDALCSQTLKNIEIIGINDGSPDASLEILKAYANKDSRIVIIDKANSGYGSSLNLAMKQARGAYIGIIEPDDFPSRAMFGKLYKAACRFDADVAKANYFEHRDGKDYRIENLKNLPYKKVFNTVDQPHITCTIPSVWAGIYKREFLEKHSIVFCETPGASFQDAAFTLKVWFAAERCVLLRQAFVHYRVDNPNSSVKTNDKVFAVNDELESAESFLRTLGERSQVFLPWFHVDKFGKYRWNYDRIAEPSKRSFIEKMYEEYHGAQTKAELKKELFSTQDWELIEELLSGGSEKFVLSHPDNF